MINKLTIPWILISLVGCINYETEKYFDQENKAINDIIPQMIDYHEMVKMNSLDTLNLKLFLIATLDTQIYEIYKPDGYVVSENGNNLPDEEITERQKEYEEDLEKYKQELKLFSALKNGSVKRRILDYKFEYSTLKIELIPERPHELNLKQNEFGYLYVSRILFNRSYDTGYLSFSFYCGEGCAWDNNIEIVKINGRWKISRYFSGGIA